jgi:hypothetical protein
MVEQVVKDILALLEKEIVDQMQCLYVEDSRVNYVNSHLVRAIKRTGFRQRLCFQA